MVCRDEAVRLPWLLTYYRQLGITRFFVVDNGSEDGTRDFLLAQDDVHLFATDDTFGDNRAGTNWQTALMDLYGQDSWCLISDADELLVYPGSEELDLPAFCDFLEQRGVEGLMTVTLDLYPRGALADAPYAPGTPFTATAEAFDPGPYRAHGSHGFPPLKIRGGAQDRFVARARHVDPSIKGPVLKRLPLVHWRKGLRLSASAHALSPAIHLAEASGAMLHFKFLGSQFLKDRARRAKAGRGRHGVRRYRAFSAAVEGDGDLVLEYEDSRTYENSRQLLDLGLIYCSESLGRELQQRSSDGVGEDWTSLVEALHAEPRGLAALLQREILSKKE